MEKEIKNQVANTEPSEVTELILDKWKGSSISEGDKSLLETYENTEFLSLTGCGLQSLENFPDFPNLIKLELSDNKVKKDLENLTHLKELLELSLAGNQITTLDDLKKLVPLESLISLDLFGNPVTETEGYRDWVFESFPNMQILDGLDRNGEEASLSDSEEEEDDEEENFEDFIENESEAEEVSEDEPEGFPLKRTREDEEEPQSSKKEKL